MTEGSSELAFTCHAQGLLELVALGQFRRDKKANRDLNMSRYDWVKLISGSAAGWKWDQALDHTGCSGGLTLASARVPGLPRLRCFALTGAGLARPRRLGAVGLDHAWHGERGSSRGSSLSGRSAGWWMCWAVSARHPGQASPSTMSYSFPVSLPAPPPPSSSLLPAALLQSLGLSGPCPLAAYCQHAAADPLPLDSKTLSSLLDRSSNWRWAERVRSWRPERAAGTFPMCSLPIWACWQGLPSPAASCLLGAACLQCAVRKRGRLPGKTHGSPAVFPPASLFLSVHLFSLSSRLYFKDDVLPSTSLPPAGRWISSVPWNRARTINIYGYQGKVEL